MRYVFCAQCGTKIEVLRKAVPALGKVFDIIRPHNCKEATNEEPADETMQKMVRNEKAAPPNLDKIFDSFKYVQKLNDLEPVKNDPVMEDQSDKRSKDHLRKELPVSTAPPNLLRNIANIPHTSPAGDINEEPKGD